MTTLKFLLDVSAPDAQKVFTGVGVRLDELDRKMRETRELSIGDADAMAKIAKTQLAADRLRERLGTMDVTLRGAQKAEIQLLELEGTAGKVRSQLDTKLSDGNGLQQIDNEAKKAEKSLSGLSGPLKGISPMVAGIGAAAITVGPQLLGATAALAGFAAAAGAGAIGAASFAAIAVPMFKNVATAQKSVASAQQAYQVALASPSHTAAMANVTKAQDALTAAQKKYGDNSKQAKAAQQALTAAQTSAGNAYQTEQAKINAATKGLTASEKQLAIELATTKTAWDRLNASMQPVVERALQPWFGVVRQGFGFMPSLIKPASEAIRTLGQDARTALQGKFWNTFFKDLGDTGGIALNAFGHAVGYVADGLAHLFVTFKPDIDKLPAMVNGWAASFDNWAKHYSRSGFDAFLRKTFNKQNMDNLKSSLKAIGDILGNVAKSVQNISPLAMTGLSNVLVALSKLTPGQIEALGVLYTASRFTPGGVGNLGSVFGGKGGGAGGTGGGVVAAGGPFGLGLGIGTILQAEGNRLAPPGSPAGAVAARIPTTIPGVNGLAAWAGMQVPKFKGIGGSLITGLADGIASKSTSVADGLRRYVYKPATAFFSTFAGGAGTWLVTHGKNLIFGLGHGLYGGSNLPTWLRATAFIPSIGFFASYKGGAVSWLVQHGKNMIFGLGHGLYSGQNTAGWLNAVSFAPAMVFMDQHAGGTLKWLFQHGKNAIFGFGHGLYSGQNTAGWLNAVSFAPAMAYMYQHAGGAGKWLFQHGKNMIFGLGHGLYSGQNTAGWLNAVSYVPAINFFAHHAGGAVSWLFSHGKNLIFGLGHGMYAAYAGVKNWIGDFKTTVVQAVVDLFKITSPSKVMMPYGEHIVNGLIEGMLRKDPGAIAKVAFGSVKKEIGNIGNWLSHASGWMASLFAGLFGGGGGNVGAYKDTILEALRLLNQPASLLGAVEHRMAQESSGNMYAVNRTDSNWLAGHPSVGLMQVIGPTFARYAGPFRNTGPFAYGVSENPLANIYAGLNYAQNAYPSLYYAMMKPGGYKVGSWNLPADELAMVHKGEMILPEKLASAVRSAVSKGGDGARSGPLVHVENMQVREPADLGLLAAKISFAVVSSGLGS